MIDTPNYTQTPNVFYDEIMATLDNCELRVLLAIMRKTFGWGKKRDRISLSEIMKVTALSRQGVLNGLYGTESEGHTGLINRHLVNCYESKTGNEYEVNVLDHVVNDVDHPLVNNVDHVVNDVDQTSQRRRPEVVNDVDQTSQRRRPEVVNDVDIQKKDIKKFKESKSVADKPHTNHFQKPALEDVQAYCQERKNQVDSERFINFYESKGWMVGRNPMKDWKAAVRTWEKSNSFSTSSGWKTADIPPHHSPARVCEVCGREYPSGSTVTECFTCGNRLGSPELFHERTGMNPDDWRFQNPGKVRGRVA